MLPIHVIMDNVHLVIMLVINVMDNLVHLIMSVLQKIVMGASAHLAPQL